MASGFVTASDNHHGGTVVKEPFGRQRVEANAFALTDLYYNLAIDQALDDAPDGGVRDDKALRAQQRTELGFAPHRIIKPQCRDRANQRIGPGLGPHLARAARAQIGPLFPAIERMGTKRFSAAAHHALRHDAMLNASVTALLEAPAAIEAQMARLDQ